HGVDESPDLSLGRLRRGALDLLDADRRALAVLERELLELAQQPLLTLADLCDKRLRGGALDLDPEPGALRDDPLRQLARLERGLGVDVSARLLHGGDELRRDLRPPLLAGEEGDGRVRC